MADLCEQIMSAVNAAGRDGATKSEIIAKTNHVKRAERDAALARLVESGLIMSETTYRSGSGRLPTVYFTVAESNEQLMSLVRRLSEVCAQSGLSPCYTNLAVQMLLRGESHG